MRSRSHVLSGPPVLGLAGLAVALSFICPAYAQSPCEPYWHDGFAPPGMDNTVYALTVFDDGGGSALYAAGNFTTAGGVVANHIAKWDGTEWTSVGGGVDGVVHALAVFDDGSGAALYAAGGFTTAGGVAVGHIAKWNGVGWESLGSGVGGGPVAALSVYDDGSGPALYAGGHFRTAGGTAASHIAKWDGNGWSRLGLGTNNAVLVLTVFDDGDGPALYAGGEFLSAGGTAASRVARWNGSTWARLDSGVAGSGVFALGTHDNGSGPALYVAGLFSSAGGMPASNIARWDGSTWTPLGSGLNQRANALCEFDDGDGPVLYAGGGFSTAGGAPAKQMAKWSGGSWSSLGSGMNNPVYALAVFDDGSGPCLYAGGWFATAGGTPATRIARWNGTNWSPLTGGGGMAGYVEALAVFNDGEGPALYAGGSFPAAGESAAKRIARWNGDSWAPLLDGTTGGPVNALSVFDDGGGPALYAGGGFDTAGGVSANSIAKWNGVAWAPLGQGIDGDLYALTVFDDGDGEALYAGGEFSTAGGGPALNIAKWDGSSWSPLGVGIDGTGVYALAAFDDGGGPALYAAGDFDTAGAVEASHIAKWDGSTWSPLDSGITGTAAYALAVFDDGSGAALYAGGDFVAAGGLAASHIAKWNGSNWSALSGDVIGWRISALTVFDDGSGPALYAGGSYSSAGGVAARNIAKWDGLSWSLLGGGTSVGVRALTVFDDTSGQALYAGGWFTIAGGVPSSYIAKWGGCACPGDVDIDGVVDVTDLTRLLSNFGTTGGATRRTGDLDGDGDADLSDLTVLLAYFGTSC